MKKISNGKSANSFMNKKQNKILFFGTPEFAAIVLEMMIKSDFKPSAVITEPDKPAGRKQILTPSPVKQIALKYSLPIFQPEKLPEIANQLRLLNPDLFVVTAYGRILSSEILKIPLYGSLNIHPSLLPKYRGATPIQAAILNGDESTGISIILMDEKIDHGPILAQQELKISKITYPELSIKLAVLGTNLLIDILPKFLAGEIEPAAQNHKKASFTKRIGKQDGKIDWTKSSQEIERMIRAYQIWPGTFTVIKSESTVLNNKTLKIIQGEILKTHSNKKPGNIFFSENQEIAVVCGQDALILKQLQLEGKKITAGNSFLNGYPKIIESSLK